MESNKTGRYFKYAIGEIVLVVIGILIALQINNWNEYRKQKQEERQMLMDIYNNIQECIADMYEGIKTDTGKKQNTEFILNAIEKEVPFSPEFKGVFATFWSHWIPDFTDGAYENIKSKGLYQISNPDLRDRISKLFEIELSRLDGYLSEMDTQYTNSFILPILNKYFVRDWKQEKLQKELIPKDYPKLMHDEDFFTILTEIRYRRMQRVERYQETIEKAKETSRLIALELERFN